MTKAEQHAFKIHQLLYSAMLLIDEAEELMAERDYRASASKAQTANFAIEDLSARFFERSTGN